MKEAIVMVHRKGNAIQTTRSDLIRLPGIENVFEGKSKV